MTTETRDVWKWGQVKNARRAPRPIFSAIVGVIFSLTLFPVTAAGNSGNGNLKTNALSSVGAGSPPQR